jgi:hypothetical protein
MNLVTSMTGIQLYKGGSKMARRRIGVLVALCMMMSLLLVQSASAVMFRNTINPDVTMNANGRHLNVRGPIGCDPGDLLRIRITVTQASTGAIAQGYTNYRCTGEDFEWTLKAVAYGAARFEEGEAQACALGSTRQGNTITDVRQWCAANGVLIRYE